MRIRICTPSTSRLVHWQERQHRFMISLAGATCREILAEHTMLSIICLGMMTLSSLDGAFAWGVNHQVHTLVLNHTLPVYSLSSCRQGIQLTTQPQLGHILLDGPMGAGLMPSSLPPLLCDLRPGW